MIRKTRKRENIYAEDNAGQSAARVAGKKKCSGTTRKRENIQAEDNAGHIAARVAEQNK